jgi:hypothetical protein
MSVAPEPGTGASGPLTFFLCILASSRPAGQAIAASIPGKSSKEIGDLRCSAYFPAVRCKRAVKTMKKYFWIWVESRLYRVIVSQELWSIGYEGCGGYMISEHKPKARQVPIAFAGMT